MSRSHPSIAHIAVIAMLFPSTLACHVTTQTNSFPDSSLRLPQSPPCDEIATVADVVFVGVPRGGGYYRYPPALLNPIVKRLGLEPVPEGTYLCKFEVTHLYKGRVPRLNYVEVPIMGEGVLENPEPVLVIARDTGKWYPVLADDEYMCLGATAQFSTWPELEVR